jgi:hypothetical protein
LKYILASAASPWERWRSPFVISRTPAYIHRVTE